MTKAERIAAGLTKAQRGVIRRSMPNGELLDAGAFFDLPSELATVVPAGFGIFDYLTPLGLEVRAILERNEHG